MNKEDYAMNRERKFRGYSTTGWIYGDLVQWKSKNKAAILPQEGDQWTNPYNHEVDPNSVGEFTGLTDKNNKEVFEGDIVKIHELPIKVKEIIFSNGMFNTKNKKSITPLIWHGNAVEIIGNIYENPDQ